MEILTRQSLHFIIAVILTRILSPDAFGVYALLALYIGVAGIFIDFGMGSALIQNQDATADDESAMFWFNLLVAILTALFLTAAAPSLARFYEVPGLQSIAYVLALNLVISATGNVHRALLAKRFYFRQLTFTSLFVVVLSGFTAITAGLAGYGALTLALQALTAGVAGTSMLWILSDWRPRPYLNAYSLRRLITFGRYWFGVQLLNIFHVRLNTVFIGKYHGPEVLGYYMRGETTTALPATMVSSIFERVAFPAFSRLTSDQGKFRQQVRATLRISMLINAPVILGLLVVSDSFVVIVFGESWQPAVPYVQILCLSRLFIPVYDINLLVFMASGRPKDYFYFECLTRPVFLVLTVCAAMISVEAIAWSMVISAWISSFLMASKAGKVIGYELSSQVHDLAPSILLATSMAIAVWAIPPIFAELPAVVELSLQVIAGIFLFSGLAISFNRRAIRDLRNMLIGYREIVVSEPG